MIYVFKMLFVFGVFDGIFIKNAYFLNFVTHGLAVR
jgi:hypothetical protein